MTGEFTGYCNHYYNLKQLLLKREKHFQNMVNDAPIYNGQTLLSEIDAIIAYYRLTQAANAEVDETLEDISNIEGTILIIMRHFGIPPGLALTGEIPGELEYEILAGEDDTLHIVKTKSLQPEQVAANIIEIKLSGGFYDKNVDGKGKR